jgi:hypothetical protein
MSRSITTTEVAKHKDDGSGYWVIIEDGVYDLTCNYLISFGWPCLLRRENSMLTKASSIP